MGSKDRRKSIHLFENQTLTLCIGLIFAQLLWIVVPLWFGICQVLVEFWAIHIAFLLWTLWHMLSRLGCFWVSPQLRSLISRTSESSQFSQISTPSESLAHLDSTYTLPSPPPSPPSDWHFPISLHSHFYHIRQWCSIAYQLLSVISFSRSGRQSSLSLISVCPLQLWVETWPNFPKVAASWRLIARSVRVPCQERSWHPVCPLSTAQCASLAFWSPDVGSIFLCWDLR